jgi:hypothetical protein
MCFEARRECSNLVLVSQLNFELDLEAVQRRSEEGVVLQQGLRVARMLSPILGNQQQFLSLEVKEKGAPETGPHPCDSRAVRPPCLGHEVLEEPCQLIVVLHPS